MDPVAGAAAALSPGPGAETQLLINDEQRRDPARVEVAPDDARPARAQSEVLASVARRMLVDDEDLAIDQVRAAGREDDPALVSARASPGRWPRSSPLDRPNRSSPDRAATTYARCATSSAGCASLSTPCPPPHCSALTVDAGRATSQTSAMIAIGASRLCRPRPAASVARVMIMPTSVTTYRLRSTSTPRRCANSASTGSASNANSATPTRSGPSETGSKANQGTRRRPRPDPRPARRAGDPSPRNGCSMRSVGRPISRGTARPGTGPPCVSASSGATTTSTTRAPLSDRHLPTSGCTAHGTRPKAALGRAPATARREPTAHDRGVDLGIG